MAAGLGLLHLPPRDFWSMTLSELDAALRGHFGLATTSHPLDRRHLETLMQRFPDR